MTAAIFGLIGVVIGALITGGTKYALQVRAERREIRAAARLMLQELTNTATTLSYALEHDVRALLEKVSPCPVDPWIVPMRGMMAQARRLCFRLRLSHKSAAARSGPFRGD